MKSLKAALSAAVIAFWALTGAQAGDAANTYNEGLIQHNWWVPRNNFPQQPAIARRAVAKEYQEGFRIKGLSGIYWRSVPGFASVRACPFIFQRQS